MGLTKLPKYVNGYVDGNGHTRHYLRRTGLKRIPLPGLPWSPPFMAAYELALAMQDGDVAKLAAAKAGADAKPFSMRALTAQYYQSTPYLHELGDASRSVVRNLIEKFLREAHHDNKLYADKDARTIERRHILKLMAERSEQPDSANGLRRVMRALMKCAVDLGWRKDDPTQGIGKLKSKNPTGYHTWTDEEIAQFEAYWEIGTKPRLAMALGLYFGQARADVVKMGQQHVGGGVLKWTRRKTRTTTALELNIPVHHDLARIIEATPSGHLTYLVTEFGKPFADAGFGNWFRDRCNEAGMPARCSFHGLRKAACVRLADAGCDPIEIAAITGHKSLKEVQRYIEMHKRKLAAQRAMDKLKGSKTEHRVTILADEIVKRGKKLK